MRRFTFIILIVLVLSTLNISPLAGSLTLSPEIEKIFFEGVNHLYRDEFESAFAKFDSIRSLKPDDPMGYFCKAFVYDYIMDEYRTLFFMEQFDEEVETAIKKAEELEEKGHHSSEMYLFTGGAIGMRGIRRAMIGNWFGAFTDALKAAGKLTKSVEIDSTMYDAYFGLGTYHYWKSVKSKIFWWLPFIGDQRQQGIDEIKLSIEKGKFTPIPSEVSLLRIYLEEKNFDEVIKLADKLMKSHDNINSLWFKGYALIYSEQWSESIDIYNFCLTLRNKAGVLLLLHLFYPEGLYHHICFSSPGILQNYVLIPYSWDIKDGQLQRFPLLWKQSQ